MSNIKFKKAIVKKDCISLTDLYLCDGIKKPRTTEKAIFLEKTYSTFVFEVDKKMNKVGIRMAFEKIFNAEVKDVRTSNESWGKKAIVRLKPGSSLDFGDFDEYR